MRLTVMSDYSLRVLMYLAVEPGRRATIQEIATAYQISEKHLMKVVNNLEQFGFTEAGLKQQFRAYRERFVRR